MATTYPDETCGRLVDLCALYLRAPLSAATDSDTRAPVLTFEPPLDAAEQTAYAQLLRMARARFAGTLAEWQAIEPHLATLRTFRQRTTAQWNALTAAQRDTQLIAGVNALIDVLRQELRDA